MFCCQTKHTSMHNFKILAYQEENKKVIKNVFYAYKKQVKFKKIV